MIFASTASKRLVFRLAAQKSANSACFYRKAPSLPLPESVPEHLWEQVRICIYECSGVCALTHITIRDLSTFITSSSQHKSIAEGREATQAYCTQSGSGRSIWRDTIHRQPV